MPIVKTASAVEVTLVDQASQRQASPQAEVSPPTLRFLSEAIRYVLLLAETIQVSRVEPNPDDGETVFWEPVDWRVVESRIGSVTLVITTAAGFGGAAVGLNALLQLCEGLADWRQNRRQTSLATRKAELEVEALEQKADDTQVLEFLSSVNDRLQEEHGGAVRLNFSEKPPGAWAEVGLVAQPIGPSGRLTHGFIFLVQHMSEARAVDDSTPSD